ncbi:hypothetical protein HON22_00050 [Candidatus Peregrinibacteria bacterium]|jgi:hypothetical protein|nr:hypothetical protein [Candidatus Peregrinibacteria bacterium]
MNSILKLFLLTIFLSSCSLPFLSEENVGIKEGSEEISPDGEIKLNTHSVE